MKLVDTQPRGGCSASCDGSTPSDGTTLLVNYLYDIETAAKNHEDYVSLEPVTISSKPIKNIQGNKKKS